MIKWYLRNLRELPTIAHCIGPRFTFSCSSLWRRMLSTIRQLCLKVLHEHTCTTQWARSPGSTLALHTSISIHSSVLCCVLVLRRTQPLNSGDRQQWTDEHTGCWLQSWLLDNVDCQVAAILPRIDNRSATKSETLIIKMIYHEASGYIRKYVRAYSSFCVDNNNESLKWRGLFCLLIELATAHSILVQFVVAKMMRTMKFMILTMMMITLAVAMWIYLNEHVHDFWMCSGCSIKL